MQPTRRDFNLLSLTAIAAGACTSACSSTSSTSAPAALAPAHGPIDIGPAERYAKDGVYTTFAQQGFFVIRRGSELFALSSVCTHRQCIIDAQDDGTFGCPCHGAQYDKDGHVTEEPATRDLPHYPVTATNTGHLSVTL